MAQPSGNKEATSATRKPARQARTKSALSDAEKAHKAATKAEAKQRYARQKQLVKDRIAREAGDHITTADSAAPERPYETQKTGLALPVFQPPSLAPAHPASSTEMSGEYWDADFDQQMTLLLEGPRRGLSAYHLEQARTQNLLSEEQRPKWAPSTTEMSDQQWLERLFRLRAAFQQATPKFYEEDGALDAQRNFHVIDGIQAPFSRAS